MRRYRDSNYEWDYDDRDLYSEEDNYDLNDLLRTTNKAINFMISNADEIAELVSPDYEEGPQKHNVRMGKVVPTMKRKVASRNKDIIRLQDPKTVSNLISRTCKNIDKKKVIEKFIWLVEKVYGGDNPPLHVVPSLVQKRLCSRINGTANRRIVAIRRRSGGFSTRYKILIDELDKLSRQYGYIKDIDPIVDMILGDDKTLNIVNI